MPAPIPRIGITTYREPAAWGVWAERADLLPVAYADAVTAAGATALLLPPGPVEHAGPVLDGLDGLILAGGADVDPARYGAPRHPRTDAPRADRDGWELALAAAARQRHLPLLGICRGLQVINVLLGGTLVQHLPDDYTGTTHCGPPGTFGDHPVRVDPASRLGTIVGAGADVPTHHHQGIGRLADSLVATAWSADGLIEAAEEPGEAWVLGVQWHPEVRAGSALFAAFAAACAARVEPVGRR